MHYPRLEHKTWGAERLTRSGVSAVVSTGSLAVTVVQVPSEVPCNGVGLVWPKLVSSLTPLKSSNDEQTSIL